MFSICAIQDMLRLLQEETPNWGGQYHFTKIDMPHTGDVFTNLHAYLLRFEPYRDPYITGSVTSARIYVEYRDPENLRIHPVEDFEKHLAEKLDFWSTHRTGMDRRETITEWYKPLEAEFRAGLLSFLQTDGFVGAYTITGVETQYCFGYDHVNDDTLIITQNGCYVLHFGWSS